MKKQQFPFSMSVFLKRALRLLFSVLLIGLSLGLSCPEDDDLSDSPCQTVADCDDGRFCNGGETCVMGTCVDGVAPCPAEVCVESMDFCPEDPNMDIECNPLPGFDVDGLEGSEAAAIRDIMFPGESGDGTTSQSCIVAADCVDGDNCTNDECVGVFDKVCRFMLIDGCEGPPQVRNGDEIAFDFDHTIVSLTVNGESVDPDLLTWTASGLPAGLQTLRIDWQNRAGADPASGCHEIEILVVP